MKQVWSISVVAVFAILEARVECANFAAVSAGGSGMALLWHGLWLAIDLSASLVIGTVIAFIVDSVGEYVDGVQPSTHQIHTPK